MFYNCHNEDLCLINYAFSNKIFPYDIKTAEISHNFKENDDLAKDNYKPILLVVQCFCRPPNSS